MHMMSARELHKDDKSRIREAYSHFEVCSKGQEGDQKLSFCNVVGIAMYLHPDTIYRILAEEEGTSS